MENLGTVILVLGYTLLWTGIQNFRGNKTSVLEALGLKGADSSSSFGGGNSNSSSGNQPSNQPSSTTAIPSPSPTTNGGSVFV